MKIKRYISGFCTAALVLAAAGCGKTPEPEQTQASKVPIEINTVSLPKLGLTTTRGPVDGWNRNEVYMACYEENDSKPIFANEYERALKGLVADNKTTFQPLLFYPINSTKNIYLRGFHPRDGIVNLNADLEIVGNKIEYLITGQEDIMISNTVSGSTDNTMAAQYEAGTGGKLEYNHLLTQIVFTLKADASFPKSMKVDNIHIKDISKTAVLDLDPDLDWDDNAILEFTKDPLDTEISAFSSPRGYVLSTTESSQMAAMMIQAGEPFYIEIEFSTGDKVEVTSVIDSGGVDITEGHTERGYKYEIKLLFHSTGLNPSVTADWSVVNTGIGPIDPDQKKWW